MEIDLTDEIDISVEGVSPKKSALNPHEVWLSADGAWVRKTDAFGGTHTLAGDVADVAQINNPSQAEQVWASYKADANQADRDQLIVFYSPLVKYVAGRVAAGLPQNVDQADLVSYGMFGLIDAITKFDPERGFKFETYAISRIKGNILDELRAIDWVPRSVRAKARQIEKAYAKLEAKLHRAPTEDEVADELDMSVEQLQTALSK
ncbi:MAG: sigma-70 family RNA polymerase sigma factor, partial [Acidimicrobiia bacterium]|nr:sigma-70 family RNA polymerase sigma factor [Acidimicrobiia bacterium]